MEIIFIEQSIYEKLNKYGLNRIAPEVIQYLFGFFNEKLFAVTKYEYFLATRMADETIWFTNNK